MSREAFGLMYSSVGLDVPNLMPVSVQRKALQRRRIDDGNSKQNGTDDPGARVARGSPQGGHGDVEEYAKHHQRPRVCRAGRPCQGCLQSRSIR